MNHSQRVSIAVAILGVFAVARIPAAHACSCTNERTVLEEFAIAHYVFGGTVTSVQPTSDSFNVIATFTPTIRWKGGLNSVVNVYTPRDESTCGFPFEVGESYLVFAFNSFASGQTGIWTHACSRNRPLADYPGLGLPPPEQPVPTVASTWGAVKTIYR
ncbi:MAG: hypothetical protein HOP12_05610 [Candidatus Eisenbacteria bacterium]|uniref:Tissue inhibitor of metalloproteinase n=1 Tax=Eiseniibacteriota bacterium TaxID=2212470 RepID=A0A849SJ31_UNCEI|nr:hypothetical protein [Candidatus Eisenbacteria bacterium]